MEHGIIVVTVEAMLKEISAGERCLLRPEFETDIARGSIQDTGSGRLRLEIVDCRHFGNENRDAAKVLQANEAFL